MNYFKYIAVLLPLISAIEKLKGAGNGAEKRKAVIELFRLMVTIAGGVGVVNATDAKFIGQLVDLIVAYLNETGRWDDANPLPPPQEGPDYTHEFHDGADLSDETLKAKGYKVGDNVYKAALISGVYRVFPAGNIVDSNWVLLKQIA